MARPGRCWSRPITSWTSQRSSLGSPSLWESLHPSCWTNETTKNHRCNFCPQDGLIYHDLYYIHYTCCCCWDGFAIFFPHTLETTTRLPDIKPENRSMRGTAKLQTDPSQRIWNCKVQELAHRSIDLESLLDFYEKLGSEVMKHYDPHASTTADVVRQAVIPLSRVGDGGVSYTDYLVIEGKPSRQMPDCMVTHTWSGLFVHLVAAVVSDALELDEYHQIAAKISEGKLGMVRQWLADKGVLQNHYWICCFCVNQHASICNGVGSAPDDPAARTRWERNRRDTATGQLLTFCTCAEPKVLNDQPDRCELNKFHVMMLWLQQANPKFRQLVAADCEFTVFERLWCVAELVAAHDADIPQCICLHSNKPFEFEDGDLSLYAKLINLSVVTDLKNWVWESEPKLKLTNRTFLVFTATIKWLQNFSLFFHRPVDQHFFRVSC